MSGDAVVAIREERARVGNVEVTRKTALVATDEGVIVVQAHTIEQQPGPYRSGYQALPGPRGPTPAIQYESEKNCCDYCCCECDSDYSWYNLQGKGCVMVLMLLLMYLVLFFICLPFLILYALLFCICYPFCKDNDNNYSSV